jgi:hypothetical protein
MIEWILLSGFIGAASLFIGIVLALKMRLEGEKGKPPEPNYYSFFVMGLCFVPFGFIFSETISPGFMGVTVLGMVYMAIGLRKKHLWRNPPRKKV